MTAGLCWPFSRTVTRWSPQGGGTYAVANSCFTRSHMTPPMRRILRPDCFLERLVHLCFERGLHTLDFMPGEEAYKRIWATDYVQTESYTGPLSWRGRLIFRLASLQIESIGFVRHN